MRRALGKGLSQLIAEQYDAAPNEIPIESIDPNPRQPRTHFDEAALEELANSIREFGVIQPLIVRPSSEGRYELIAGERRWRAAKLAGLESVPVAIRSAAAQASLEIAIIENVQREDINAVESARAYQRLIEEFGLTQEQVALRVGKSRTAVSNTIRLLKLGERVLGGLEGGRITEGHARALLAFPDLSRDRVYDRIIDQGLTVREVERLSTPSKPKGIKSKPETVADPDTLAVEATLSEHLAAPVKISSGKITIEFYGDEDLNRILERMGALE